MHQTEFWILLTLSIIPLTIFNLKAKNNKSFMIREFYVLGTIIQLKVYGSNGKRAIEEAVSRLNDIDNKGGNIYK